LPNSTLAARISLSTAECFTDSFLAQVECLHIRTYFLTFCRSLARYFYSFGEPARQLPFPYYIANLSDIQIFKREGFILFFQVILEDFIDFLFRALYQLWECAESVTPPTLLVRMQRQNPKFRESQPFKTLCIPRQ
jgi:hypothetical protein